MLNPTIRRRTLGQPNALPSSLHPVLRELARDLTRLLAEGNAPHAPLGRRAAAYAGVADQALAALDMARLYAEGVRLANAAQAAAQAIETGDLPVLGVEAKEALDSLLALHGTFVLSTAEGTAALAREERYQRRPDEERAFRADAGEVALALQASPGIMTPDAALTVLGAAEETAQGSHPERSAVQGFGTVRNALIVLSAGALVGSAVTGLIPGLGTVSLWVGAGAGLSAAWLGKLILQKGIEGSQRFKAATGAITRQIDAKTPAFDAETTRLMEGLARQSGFLLSIEAPLRRLARGSRAFAFLNGVLDALKRRGGDKS